MNHHIPNGSTLILWGPLDALRNKCLFFTILPDILHFVSKNVKLFLANRPYRNWQQYLSFHIESYKLSFWLVCEASN